jgi:soluble lytic murein transglycosylase-like protein
MAKKTSKTKTVKPHRDRRIRLIIAAAIMAVLIVIEVFNPSALLRWLPFVGSGNQSITNPDAPLAEFYAPEVLRWRSQIEDWAKEYDVNPNVIAIVMQIESCGDPTAISSAGAMGLMQVMPFHFDNGENMINPDANVKNGMTVFYECLTQFADWDLGLALACYNGGPRVTMIDQSAWAQETQSYYRWATGMWNDVKSGKKTSDTLSEWMQAGGSRLCTTAATSRGDVALVLPDAAAP